MKENKTDSSEPFIPEGAGMNHGIWVINLSPLAREGKERNSLGRGLPGTAMRLSLRWNAQRYSLPVGTLASVPPSRSRSQTWAC